MVAEHPHAGVIELEVDLPDFDALPDRLAHLGLDDGVMPAWQDLEAGVVVQEADQQDRALAGGEAFAEFADAPDEPAGGSPAADAAGSGCGRRG